MKLPLCASLPHAGLAQPVEVGDRPILAHEDVVRDGDEGAAEIYAPLGAVASVWVKTDVARAFVDMNRAESDRRKDGVVKTHTCLDVPIYSEPLPEDVVQSLLARYHRPYHKALSEAASRVRFGIDCHTMLAVGPPVGPDEGSPRPPICLANADGTFPQGWMDILADCLSTAFGLAVSINRPFRGGHILRSHGSEMPWVMLELSRAPFLSNAEKGRAVLTAVRAFCERASLV